ncbi:MAG: hypothetical protein ACXVA9_05310 [Bdellovibrionales bacterium]
MRQLILVLATFVSASAFALGNTDKSKIDADLDKLKTAGFECKEKWAEGFYMSQAAPNQKFSVELNCNKSGGEVKKATIVYQLDSNQYARCRDIRAISFHQEDMVSEGPSLGPVEAGT